MDKQKAIQLLCQMYLPNFDSDEKEALSMAIESLYENIKLEAKIEEYKVALTTWNNANNSLLKYNQELKDKIKSNKEI